MSVLNVMAQQNLASSSAQLGTAAAKSSFLEKNGKVVGVLLSLTYISASVFFMHKLITTKDDNKNKSLILAGLTLPIILGIVDLGYYAKHRNDEDQKAVNSTVANISLIPIYLALALVVMTIIVNMSVGR